MAIDEFHLAAWRAFINSHASVLGLIETELVEAGQVPLTSLDVLIAVSEAPDGRLRLHELARRVVLSRSGLTRLVDRLERAGLLTRDLCDTDRRGAYAVLTPEGREALDRARPVYAQSIANHFSRYLNDEEVAALTRALNKVDAAARSR